MGEWEDREGDYCDSGVLEITSEGTGSIVKGSKQLGVFVLPLGDSKYTIRVDGDTDEQATEFQLSEGRLRGNFESDGGSEAPVWELWPVPSPWILSNGNVF